MLRPTVFSFFLFSYNYLKESASERCIYTNVKYFLQEKKTLEMFFHRDQCKYSMLLHFNYYYTCIKLSVFVHALFN